MGVPVEAFEIRLIEYRPFILLKLPCGKDSDTCRRNMAKVSRRREVSLAMTPTPARGTPSTMNGRAIFGKIGCVHCHTPSFTTGRMIASGSSKVPSAALSNQTVNLFSDLLVHHMGRGLADGITQGSAGPDEFRTAPLWGVGQRIFFLHDGRTSNLVEAIEAHRSKDSEANKVIDHFNRLKARERQDIINFLRSL